jgi:hypothetical protein
MSLPETPAPTTAEQVNAACYELSRQIAALSCCVPQAAPLARTLVRVVGRVVIDTGPPGSDPGVWEGTEQMALEWIRDAIRPLGYDLRPLPDSGRPEIGEGS